MLNALQSKTCSTKEMVGAMNLGNTDLWLWNSRAPRNGWRKPVLRHFVDAIPASGSALDVTTMANGCKCPAIETEYIDAALSCIMVSLIISWNHENIINDTSLWVSVPLIGTQPTPRNFSSPAASAAKRDAKPVSIHYLFSASWCFFFWYEYAAAPPTPGPSPRAADSGRCRRHRRRSRSR